jgi:hypothetical protein
MACAAAAAATGTSEKLSTVSTGAKILIADTLTAPLFSREITCGTLAGGRAKRVREYDSARVRFKLKWQKSKSDEYPSRAHPRLASSFCSKTKTPPPNMLRLQGGFKLFQQLIYPIVVTAAQDVLLRL